MRTATQQRPNAGWLRRAAQAGVAACLAATITIGGAATGASTGASAPACRSVEVPVSLAVGAAPTARLVGQLCYSTTDVAALHGAVQVLVSGTAYGQSYWDFPYQLDTYSYVRAATAAGFTTFSFDRIGIGQSTHPLSTEVTIPANAATIHQAISQLHAGSLDGVHYDRVVIVGHSLGSLISLYEAGTYHDVDAVVVSGILHTFDPVGVAQFVTTLYPAALDPKFFGRIVDPGYLTTLPGTREASFYYPPNTDPAVVATDESLKETATVPEAAGVFAQELPGLLQPVSQVVCAALATLCDGVASSLIYGITRDITVPVIEVVGQYDALLCGGATGANRCSDVAAVRQDESAYFSGIAQRCLTVAELPQSGHDVNLERNAPIWFAVANEWSVFTVQHAADGDAAGCWSDDGQSGLLFPG